METAYREWEKRRRDRAAGRHTAERRKRGTTSLGVRERQRLIQLAVCVVLFLAVFIGKGIFPERVAAAREKMLSILQTDTDFKEVFSSLGQSISAGVPVMDTLGDLWVDVFGGGTVTVSYATPQEHAPLYLVEQAYLTGAPMAGLYHLIGMTPPAEVPFPLPNAAISPVGITATQPESSAPTVEHVDYRGPAMPDNATMDRYRLGLEQTTTPALGWVSSGFGWREHPVDGQEKFHNGVDLAVNDGTPVLSFTDGVVDYIGDNPDVYGKYLQISHSNGLTSFYAHCSKLLVRQGQTVKAGEPVAESGETGNATGPHLHFELKLNGTLLNPLYYIDTQ